MLAARATHTEQRNPPAASEGAARGGAMVPAPEVSQRLAWAGVPVVRRKCACGGGGDEPCDACRDEDARLRRKGQPGREGAGEADGWRGGVDQAIRAGGRPLDPATRGFFEGRFGHGFGGVRVHTGAAADASARSVGALAYTVGRDVVFRDGQYRPGAEHGRRLLAHELAHVVQSGNPPGHDLRALRVGARADPAEGEADAAGCAATTGAVAAVRDVGTSHHAHGVLRRQVAVTSPETATDPQADAALAIPYLREIGIKVTKLQTNAVSDFQSAGAANTPEGVAERTFAVTGIWQSDLRTHLAKARSVYQKRADALASGDALRAQLRDAYLDALSAVRVAFKISLGLSQQLPEAKAAPERPAYAENLSLWLEASPMTSASLAGSSPLSAADQKVASRWEGELAAYFADVAATLSALKLASSVRSSATERILAGVRRSFLTIGPGVSGATGVRKITDESMVASRRALETELRAGMIGVQPRRIIDTPLSRYELPADNEIENRLAGNPPPHPVDMTNVPEAEKLSVHYAAWIAYRHPPATEIDKLLNAWWPVVIPVRRDGVVKQVRYELDFDAAGAVRPERIGDVVTEVPPAFAVLSVEKRKAHLVKAFGLSAVDDGTATWTSDELDALYGALALLSGPSLAAVAGVAFVRDHTYPGDTPSTGDTFTTGVTHVAEHPGVDGAAEPKHPPPHIHLYDIGFIAGKLQFSGAPGAALPGVTSVIAHEVGHMAMGRADMAANAKRAALPTTLTVSGPMSAAAISAFNAWKSASASAHTAVDAFWKAEKSGTARVGGYRSTLDVATLRAKVTAAVVVRNSKRQALAAAGVPTEVISAATTRDAADDSMVASAEQVTTFVALAERLGFHRFTDYAETSRDEDWFAETHALWVTDPDRLFSMSRSVFLWFQAGMPMDPAWNPPE